MPIGEETTDYIPGLSSRADPVPPRDDDDGSSTSSLEHRVRVLGRHVEFLNFPETPRNESSLQTIPRRTCVVLMWNEEDILGRRLLWWPRDRNLVTSWNELRTVCDNPAMFVSLRLIVILPPLLSSYFNSSRLSLISTLYFVKISSLWEWGWMIVIILLS